MINFRDFAWFLGISCRADLPERLKLLYRLHLPPALLDTDRDERDMVEDSSPKSDETDDAVEAAEFFEEGEVVLHRNLGILMDYSFFLLP